METLNLTTIGKLAAELQCPVDVLRRIAASAGIKPFCRINGLPHFTEEAAEKISTELAKARE